MLLFPALIFDDSSILVMHYICAKFDRLLNCFLSYHSKLLVKTSRTSPARPSKHCGGNCPWRGQRLTGTKSCPTRSATSSRATRSQRLSLPNALSCRPAHLIARSRLASFPERGTPGSIWYSVAIDSLRVILWRLAVMVWCVSPVRCSLADLPSNSTLA